ncbi:hypothetical protein BJF83_22445 [Nocardiopsis sp. CNR-923]|uniref:hypothetical protein n=1 Tax=Nocardiopsis sp. CNR-923 TaxID=1904965 RepID=UPI00095A84B5|nr:hypothetical protein [Nocardiopsis sp. CNR-923]OLT25844.1 hypothetical protein BJF83_22445 [Nocardiopsis sp. CNR-923]
MQHLTQLRPLRGFTQVPNAALDTLPDLNSIGLLNVVLRHDEQWHFTLDQLIAEKRRIPGPTLGRDVAYKAMRTLVAHRWVAKVRYRDLGGHFHTAVFRTVTPFTEATTSRCAPGTPRAPRCGCAARGAMRTSRY